MYRVFYIFIMLCSCGAAFNVFAQAIKLSGPASSETSEGMITIQSQNDMGRLAYLPDIAYANYKSGDVRLHLITPGLAQTPRGELALGKPHPLIVYVPGSAWFPQNIPAAIPGMMAFSKQSGYAVAVVAYRPSTVAKSPAQLVDVKTAIRFMRANAEKYNIDPEKIAIWGDSSGGHMASLAGVTGGIKKFVTDQYSDKSSDVQAVVNFYGPTDFLKMDEYPSSISHNAIHSPESSVIGGAIQDPKNAEKVKEYNPITYISAEKSLPPFLIMHGDEDGLVPFNQSIRLYEALKQANHNVRFYKIEGAGHGNRFFTPQTLDIVQSFFNRHLR